MIEYVSLWKVKLKDKEEGKVIRNLRSDDKSAFTKARTWAASCLLGAEFVQRRIALSAYYDGLPPKRWYETDIEMPAEYEEVVQKALDWHRSGETDIYIDLVIYYKKDTQWLEQLPPAVPSLSTPSQRASATSRQTAQAANVVEALEARGDYSALLRAAWPCS